MNLDTWLNKEILETKKTKRENFGPHTHYTMTLLKIIEALYDGLEQIKTKESKAAIARATEIVRRSS